MGWDQGKEFAHALLLVLEGKFRDMRLAMGASLFVQLPALMLIVSLKLLTLAGELLHPLLSP